MCPFTFSLKTRAVYKNGLKQFLAQIRSQVPIPSSVLFTLIRLIMWRRAKIPICAVPLVLSHSKRGISSQQLFHSCFQILPVTCQSPHPWRGRKHQPAAPDIREQWITSIKRLHNSLRPTKFPLSLICVRNWTNNVCPREWTCFTGRTVPSSHS
jgi:hypothetical protein